MDRRKRQCSTYRPSCISFTFMCGMGVGTVIHSHSSMVQTLASVVLATVVFHFAFSRNINLKGLLKKVITKGS